MFVNRRSGELPVTRTDSEPKARGRPKGGPILTRERILRTALDLADQHGIDDLSMRRLAQVLRVEAMSLYNHVANKSDLLDGLVDLVFSEVDTPTGEGEWKSNLRKWASSVRDALARHRWAIGLMESRTQPGPENLRHHDAVLAALREAGFSVRTAVHVYSLLNSYVYGFALQEVSLPFKTEQQAVEVTEAILQQFPSLEYPHLAEVGIEHVAHGYVYAEEFDFGLDAILNAMEHIRRSA